jgi:hypothetical protein
VAAQREELDARAAELHALGARGEAN